MADKLLKQKKSLGGTVMGLLAEKAREKSIPNIPEDERVTLNVGGVKHETTFETLLKKPGTRLHNVALVAKRKGLKEIYFDRHPALFGHILNYYRTDSLHVPTDVCGPMLKDELKYWEIDENQIEQCCWVTYCHYEDTLEMLRKFEADHSLRFEDKYREDENLWQKTKPKVWKWLQDPYSSKGALTYAVLSLCVVTCSITVFILETLPYFGSLTIHAKRKNITLTSSDLRKDLDIFHDISPNDVLIIIDNTCNFFFFLEFLVKFATTPDKLRFLGQPLSVIELLCLIPYYIAITVVFVHSDPITVFEIIRILLASRVLRIFRIFVLMKHFLALKILVYTMRASAKELLLLVFIVLIGIIIFACLEYYMEIFTDIDSDFEHIPLAFWWALITMTTVGYGDLHPKSGLGYVVGGLCAISGVLVIALSVPVIVNNFTVYYTHAQSRAKLKERRRRQEVANHWRKGMSMIRRNTIQRVIANGRGAKVGVITDEGETSNGHITKDDNSVVSGSITPGGSDATGQTSTRTISKINPSVIPEVTGSDVTGRIPTRTMSNINVPLLDNLEVNNQPDELTLPGTPVSNGSPIVKHSLTPPSAKNGDVKSSVSFIQT
ncbi:potassium voltage-gated channel protein Shaw [Patella vulgata]|uniref:potassium voltage-gated channel protein Shaw n=1 Tax=Patella vulgata TaxID=6465 RepID=UPI00218096C0|nr:potassium voltage-gated channel protein Shaw [Patella vulgata]